MRFRTFISWRLLALLTPVLPDLALADVLFSPARLDFPSIERCSALVIGHINEDAFLDVAATCAESDQLVVHLGNGDGTLGPPTTYLVGDFPVALTLGDFNSDSIADVAVAHYISHNIALLLGIGAGSLSTPQYVSVGAGALAPTGIAVGHLNADLYQDIVTSNLGSNNVTVLRGNGNGTFQAPTFLPAGNGPSAIAIADLDGDGERDLAVANSWSDNVAIFKGSGTGQFAPAAFYPVGDSPQSVSVGLLNGDQFVDLAIGHNSPIGIAILLGQVNGVFGSAAYFNSGPDHSPNAARIVDLNADSYGDLIALTNTALGSSLVTMLGDGAGSFGSAKLLASGEGDTALGCGDMNGDGQVDVVGSTDHNISIWSGDGTGSLGQADFMAASQPPAAVAVGHLNADLFPDILVGSSGDSITVIEGLADGDFAEGYGLFVPGDPWCVSIADLDLDGRGDIITAILQYHAVGVMYARETGGFEAPVFFSTPSVPRSIAVGDVDGNQYEDVLVACLGSSAVRILLNGPSGLSESSVFANVYEPTAVAARDLDGDGDCDVLVTNTLDRLTILENVGGGATVTHLRILDGNDGLVGIAVGMLDEDAYPDAALVCHGSNKIAVLLGLGGCEFGWPSYYNAWGSWSADVGDVTGDGTQDIVSLSGTDSNVSVLRGLASGVFEEMSRYGVGSVPASGDRALVVYDLNRDGSLDVVAANQGSRNVAVLRSTRTLTGIAEGVSEVGGGARIAALAIPNPFNPSTKITITIPSPGTVNLAIFDLAGRRVRRLIDGSGIGAGTHTLVWNGKTDYGQQASSGVYFCRLEAEGKTVTRKLILLK